MTLLSTNDLASLERIEGDVCICGAGPAGLTLAEALTQRGHRVILLESGFAQPNSETQALNKIESVGLPLREDFINRLRMLGGTSNLWSGRCALLDPIDFAKREWVDGSGWPIEYDEYLRYSTFAAKILGLPADTAQAHTDSDSGQFLQARLSEFEIQQRLALWGKAPARFWRKFYPSLVKADNCQVCMGITVTGLHPSNDGSRITRVEARKLNGSPLNVTTQCIVLAMGGWENTRTLLLSVERYQHLGISRSALGRYYMDHPKTVVGSIAVKKFSKIEPLIGRRPVSGGIRQILLGITPETQRREHLLNAHVNLEQSYSDKTTMGYSRFTEVLKRFLKRGHVGSRVDRSNLGSGRADLIHQLTPEETMPYFMFRALHGIRRIVQRPPSRVVIVNHCEQAPNRNSRITLGNARDRFGNRLLRLDWRAANVEIATLVWLQQRLGRLVECLDAGSLDTTPGDLHESDYTDAAHHMGGTRMSTDRQFGVVDSNLMVHGVKNLFVCGSSVFPTGGSANPTWTIVALAVRLSEYLDSTLRRK